MRIISLSPSITEILFALGADDQIVGVTTYCDYPEKAKTKPKMGDWVNIDFDKVKAANPDIVFTSTVVQEKISEKLKSLGLRVVHFDLRRLSDIYGSIRYIGVVSGKTKEAGELVAKMENEFENIWRGANNMKRVYVEEWPRFVSCNWVPELIEIAGGVSLGDSGVLSHKITTNAVKKFNPDIIVISWCGVGTRVPKEKIIERPGWKGIKAVMEDKIYIIDDSLLNRPGPRLVEGARLLAKLINE